MHLYDELNDCQTKLQMIAPYCHIVFTGRLGTGAQLPSKAVPIASPSAPRWVRREVTQAPSPWRETQGGFLYLGPVAERLRWVAAHRSMVGGRPERKV